MVFILSDLKYSNHKAYASIHVKVQPQLVLVHSSFDNLTIGRFKQKHFTVTAVKEYQDIHTSDDEQESAMELGSERMESNKRTRSKVFRDNEN